MMVAPTSQFASSETAAWSGPSGAIGRLLRWLTSQWRALWATPLSKRETVPTRFLEARVNGRGCTLPIVRDSLQRCEAIADACELANLSAGLETALVSMQMSAARVWLSGCADSSRAPARIAAAAGQLLQIGVEGSPEQGMPLGCIPALAVHDAAGDGVGITLYTECDDALGTSAIEAAARAMAVPLAALVGCTRAPTIQLGHVLAVRARARCRISIDQLLEAAAPEAMREPALRAACDEALSWFGVDRHQPELAAAHNAFVIEGVNAVATALGLEAWRFAASAQSHAARWGSCEPLVRWRRQAHELCGQLELPIDLDSACSTLPFVGDEQARREAARRGVQSVACAGLLASLAYVRAVVDAIARQRGSDAGTAPPADAAASGRMARDSGIAESGVRLIACEHPAARAKAG